MSRWPPIRLWPRPRASVLLSSAVASLASVARGSAVDVTVADGLSRGWVTTPPAGLTDLAELRAVAETRFQTVFRTAPAEWRIEADWSGDRAFVCSALPVALLTALHAEAEARGVLVRSIAPNWVRALQRLPLDEIANEPLAMACAASPEGVAALFLRDGVPIDWRQHWCEPAEAAHHLHGQALAAGCDLPAQAWVAGDRATLSALANAKSALRWKAVPS